MLTKDREKASFEGSISARRVQRWRGLVVSSWVG